MEGRRKIDLQIDSNRVTTFQFQRPIIDFNSATQSLHNTGQTFAIPIFKG
ncbi:unnamed protein product [Musa acuminata subsp. burmannicoides]